MVCHASNMLRTVVLCYGSRFFRAGLYRISSRKKANEHKHTHMFWQDLPGSIIHQSTWNTHCLIYRYIPFPLGRDSKNHLKTQGIVEFNGFREAHGEELPRGLRVERPRVVQGGDTNFAKCVGLRSTTVALVANISNQL